MAEYFTEEKNHQYSDGNITNIIGVKESQVRNFLKSIKSFYRFFGAIKILVIKLFLGNSYFVNGRIFVVICV